MRIVVGFAAGSVSDLVARAIGQKLGSVLGQPFVVEARPGAGSNVAAQHVARSPKDGYTLFVTTSSSTIRSASSANLGFDFSTDFAPIALVAGVPFVLTAYPGLGVRTLEEFIALAKTNQQALQPIEEGKLTALAVAQPNRAAIMPRLPTIDEAGLPGIHASLWIGILAPAGTPGAIVNMLSQAINELLQSDDFARQMRLQGMELFGGGPEEFALRIKSDTARWDTVLQTEQLGK